MNKKFYVSPEMEIEKVGLERCIMLSTSAGDPPVSDEYAEGDPDD